MEILQALLAIENAKNHDCLMILGRAGTSVGRKVGVWDYLKVNGTLEVSNKMLAANSDIYFTSTNHNHTGFGNTSGFAAIENSKNHDCLMILGRAGTSVGRKVGVWDYLKVNGVLEVTSKMGIGTTTPTYKLHTKGDIYADGGWLRVSGQRGIHFESYGGGFYMTEATWIRTYGNKNFFHNAGIMRTDGELHVGSGGNRMIVKGNGRVGIGTTAPSHLFHVKANGAVGLFESSGNNAYLRVSTNEGLNNRIELANRPGGRAAIWVATAGDALNVLKNGRVGIGITSPADTLDVRGVIRMSSSNNYCRMYVGNSNKYGAGLLLSLSKSHHGNNRTIIWNGDSNWDYHSDKSLKTNIEKEKNILERLVKLDVKRFHWKGETKEEPKPMGFIAQDVEPLFPNLVRGSEDEKTKKRIRTLNYVNFGVLAVGAIKELKQEKDKEVKALKAEIAKLKKLIHAK